MGRRVGQLAAFGAFIIMMGRLGRLLAVGPNEPQWNLILVAATFLGAIAWWLLDQVTNRRDIKLVIFGLGGLLLAFRIITPETLVAGILPSGASLAAMGEQLTEALRIIQFGVAPVTANPGLLAILALAMWAIGALFTWGSTDGPYSAMFLPSLVMYFQFAVFDRAEAGLGWMTVSGLALGLAAVSMALERRGETGRARDERGRPMPRRSLNLAAITAVFLSIGAIAVASNASTLITEYGNAPWRGGGSGFGTGPGTGGFDGVIDLRQEVLSLTEEPVFTARFSADAPPASSVYFRMGTLDEFDLEQWGRSDLSYEPFQSGSAVARESDVYQGTTFDFLANISIEELKSQQSLAPTPGVPVDIGDPPSQGRGRSPFDFNVLSDAAIFTDPNLRSGDTYQVQAQYADLDADLGLLATGEDGQLTRLFANAAAQGDFPHAPETAEPAVAPGNIETFLQLPGSLPSGIESLARSETFGATSDFERAFMLEEFFRTSGNFEYSANVSTGHDSLRLENWLTDSTSVNYRTGYCEQFAASMAVMARTLEIPSRVVWGFTPGEVREDDQGEFVIVRERNAHAWVELWIEPVGWVMFDPTPRRSETFLDQPPSITEGFDPDSYLPDDVSGDIAVPPSVDGDPNAGINFGEEEPVPLSANGPRWWLLGLVALIPLAAAIPLVKRLRRRRRLHHIREGDVTAAWDELIDRLADLGDPVPSSLTPIEVARTTDPALLPLAVSYAAAVYGGRSGEARESDFFGAELWLDNNYDTGARARAAMSVRSLLDRDR